MRLRSALALAAILAGTRAHADPPAPATTPVRGRTEPPLVVAHGRPARTARVLGGAPAAFAPFAAQGWRAIWDRDTGVPVRMWGQGIAAPNTTGDPAAAERAARAFLVAELAVLAPGAAASDFVVVANQLDGDVRTVGFAQTWRGLRVVGGQLGFVFAHDRLIAIGSEALPGVRAGIAGASSAAAPPDAPGSRVSATSRARAEAWLASEVGRTAVTRGTRGRVVLPIVRGPGDLEYHVADVLDVETPGAPGRWDVYVAADGTPLARRSTIMTATGTLAYNAGVRYASGARADYPAVTANLTVDANATVTAGDGTFTWAGSTSATVAPTCTGTSVIVTNTAGAGTTTSLPVAPGGTATWNVANSELDDAQVSTYVYGSIVLARDRLIAPTMPFLAGPVAFYVNETNPCNAFSTGSDVHLARGTSACENTGRTADIVFHEFGHSFHSHAIIAGMGAFDSALSEGLADFNAANITEDSGIGRGLDFTDKPVRDIDPPGIEKSYPADVVADPHATGEIISGALWDLRKALVAELGHGPGVTATEKIFLGVAQRAADIPTSYTAALIADDDDGNLANGTPHLCAIERAFGMHGLVPGFVPTIVSSPIVDQLAITVPVSIPTGTACPVRHVTRMHVLWKVGDGIANDLELADHGDTWTGAFPAQPDGTVVAYSVDVSFDDGSTQTFPNNPADPMYQTFVGLPSLIYCQTMDHDPNWVQGGTYSDEWEWGTPNPVATHAGDPPAAHSGTNVLGTNVTSGGAYRENESVEITTPEIDTSSYQIVHLQYWRWLTVEDAMYDQAEVLANDTSIWRNASAPDGGLDHVDREWRFHDLELTPYVGDGTVHVAWKLTSDGVYELGGWTLDDVCIVGMQKLAKCGDGYLDSGEQCDDGNTTDGDGCSATCKDELAAGGGGCCATHDGGGGPAVLGLLVIAVMRRRVRSSRRAR